MDKAAGNTSPKKTTHVAVGLIKKDREVLLAWRDQQKHQGDCYEFSGGKVDAGETPAEALVRELDEELSIQVKYPKKMTVITHAYPEKTVVLHVFLVTDYEGIPVGAEGQAVRWVGVDRLPALAFPAANAPIVRMAQLAPLYHITHAVSHFIHAADWLDFYSQQLPPHAQCYVRDNALDKADYVQLTTQLVSLRPDVSWVVMAAHSDALIGVSGIAGYHLTQDALMRGEALSRPDDGYVVAACHDAESIARANELGCDAITLSPVKPTASHPTVTPLGWQSASQMAQQANMPVYALGGMSYHDMQCIEHSCFYGLAGIRQLGLGG